ncbi:hypothetical protein [Vibrio nigripulchritudo]|uniref:hypothetical protein n=1 Tax=Vibrio nigripulchritudo TaxID=28173 RepID=UPI00248F624E|nr:hypothetical protein [Vibrio nigripulchritudo]BDU42898.1 hypothetical protein TUMSATVNIG3_16960 [Vibrio nigripulchritudo]
MTAAKAILGTGSADNKVARLAAYVAGLGEGELLFPFEMYGSIDKTHASARIANWDLSHVVKQSEQINTLFTQDPMSGQWVLDLAPRFKARALAENLSIGGRERGTYLAMLKLQPYMNFEISGITLGSKKPERVGFELRVMHPTKGNINKGSSVFYSGAYKRSSSAVCALADVIHLPIAIDSSFTANEVTTFKCELFMTVRFTDGSSVSYASETDPSFSFFGYASFLGERMVKGII